MTACVYLVRHGATAWNDAGRCQGTIDVGLSAAGRRQALELAGRLQAVRFDGAYTSPLRRASETAAILLAGRSLRAESTPALRELSYGRWQGRAPSTWPVGSAERWAHDPWRMTFPGGESLEDLDDRVGRFWDRLVSAHDGETVLVVGHGHVNRVLLLRALGWVRDRFWSIDQPSACCTVLLADGREARARFGGEGCGMGGVHTRATAGPA